MSARDLVLARYFIFDVNESRYSAVPESIEWHKQVLKDRLILHDNCQGQQEIYLAILGWNAPSVSKPIKNYGREHGDYMRWITEHYDDLADVTFFSQADPFVHNPIFIERMNYLTNEVVQRDGYIGLSTSWNRRPTYQSGLRFEVERCFGYKMPEVSNINGNGIFAVTKERIQHWPQSGYEKMAEIVSHNDLTLEVFTVENFWTYMLGEHFEHCDSGTHQPPTD